MSVDIFNFVHINANDNIVIGVYMHEVKDIDRHKLGIFVRDLLLNVEQDELPSERTQTFM